MENVSLAFLLTLLAGLSTGIGSMIAFFVKKTNEKFLSFSLGFSAGVMIYVSFVEIFTKAQETLVLDLGERQGMIFTVLSFFGGMLLIAIIDKFVPSFENPHEYPEQETIDDIQYIEENGGFHQGASSLYRMGIFSALAIAIHNFPEGFATFMSAIQDPQLGISIAIAIAIHNIPEGIAVSVPIYYATGNRKKAFLLSLLSGVSEPVGAIIAYFLLSSVMNNILFGVVFAGVAGIMVFISIDELLPTAERYGEHHTVIYGVILGMIVMAISLIVV